VSEQSQDASPSGFEHAPYGEMGQEQDHSHVAGRVAEVFRAADTAAAQIRAEAVAEAAEIRRRADEAAAAATAEAERTRSEAKAEATETRRSAVEFATQQRREAEEKAEKLLSEARAIRQASEEMAKNADDALKERRLTLQAEIRKLESKVHLYLEAFREFGSRLEELVEAQPEDVGQETLTEALEVAARREESPAEEPAAGKRAP